ncbi:MAG: ABC transporter permease subunit, partial [Comamonas sp.]|nr:ABC transporter permease subunit [Comamonas sp.]
MASTPVSAWPGAAKAQAQAPVRPEAEYALPDVPQQLTVRRLPLAKRLLQHPALRRAIILVVLAIVWELAARWQDNDLLLPTFSQTAATLLRDLANGELLGKAAVSLGILIQGYLLGVAGALLLTVLAVSSQWGRDVLTTLTSMFNPLPAIALLPLALLWLGLGQASLLAVLVHSVLWPLALATYAGFQSVPETLRMAGRNYGLRGARYVLQILVPAALPSILSGLKIGW